MNNKIPRISIIIPTRNRKDSLKETLLSLTSLNYPRNKYEVIVTNDNSSDGTEEMLADIQHILPYSIRCKRLKEKSGLSAARNLGMQIAKGEIFVFTDDDCLFEKVWLMELLKPFDFHNVGVVGGPDRTPEEANFFSKCVGYLFNSFIGTGGLRGGERLRVGRYYPKGCNMAILREAINKVGVFDEQLGPGEEIELGYRIEKVGYQIKYASRAFVWHKRKATLKTLLQKMFKIGYTRVVLARKHKGLLQIGHMIPFIAVLTFFSLLILSFIFPNVINFLIFILIIYLFTLLSSGVQALFRIKDIRALFIIPLLIPLHHSAHGIGFLVAGIKHLLGFRNIYPPLTKKCN